MAAAALSAWFRAVARDLPWRESSDPYRVWVAEIMLQQTTSAACVPYYRRFIAHFPTVEALAQASEEEVLSLWSGLGYYSRARNLHRAAQIVTARHGGRLPDSADALRALPGIGEYTAGAIRAVAFNLPGVMVDANVRRVLGRFLGIPRGGDGAETSVRRASAGISRAGEPRIVNQAMMELGALVCVPVRPLCAECPLQSSCRARADASFEWHGSVRVRLVPEPKSELCVAASLDSRWLLSRPRDGRWRGMWEFPRTDVVDGDAAGGAQALLEHTFGVTASGWAEAGILRHRVTKWDITLRVVRCRLRGEPCRSDVEWMLAHADGFLSLPLPSPMRRIARMLMERNLPLFQEDI